MKLAFSHRLRSTARVALAAACLAVAGMPAGATNTCFTYTGGHVYYVAYQNNPAGPEYVVDLGDRSVFLNATTTLTFPDIRAGDFATIFSPAAPNLWVGFVGVETFPARDAIDAANGPKDFFQLDSSSTIGGAQQLDSWATGIPQFSSEVGGPPCHLNAAQFPGKVFGSYQDTLNGFSQGSLSGNLVWNVETRLSNSIGTRTPTNKIHFYSSRNNPGAGVETSRPLGYWKVFTDGSAQYWPDYDGDFLPDVSLGSDPEADKCPGVNSTNNTDGDGDTRAQPCDCNDADATVWAIPDEATALSFTSKSSLGWSAPANPGGTALKYDVFRGGSPTAFSCFSPDQTATSVTDASSPAPGARFYYLVRAQTSCGEGTVGQGRNAPARTVPSCP